MWIVRQGGKRANLILDLLSLLLAHSAKFDCLPAHSQFHAFLQSAELASIPTDPIHHTIPLTSTLIIGWLILGTTEKALKERKIME
jgi:hypothetical protein